MQCDVRYEDLSRLVAGELDHLVPERVEALHEHVSACACCRARVHALREVEAVLRRLTRAEPSARAVLKTRRAVSRELEGEAPEIMTLDEVAEYLRVTRGDLEEARGLPAFEIAGELRVRRSRLVEWMEERERAYVRSNVESDLARILAGDFGKGVA